MARVEEPRDKTDSLAVGYEDPSCKSAVGLVDVELLAKLSNSTKTPMEKRASIWEGIRLHIGMADHKPLGIGTHGEHGPDDLGPSI